MTVIIKLHFNKIKNYSNITCLKKQMNQSYLSKQVRLKSRQNFNF